VELLQQLLGRQSTPPGRQLARLERALAAAGIGADAVPLLGALLGVPLPDRLSQQLPGGPRELKLRTHELLAGWLAGLSQAKPVLALLEDMQWADPSTLELLDLVLADLPGARVLAIATCRPDAQIVWPARSYVTQLTLGRLSPGQASELVDDILGGTALAPDVLQEVLDRADGVPLFVEELVQTMLETGLVERDGDRLVRRREGEPVAFPETLQDSLMARLDRLGPAKAVAQLAAVLGREFPYELIEAVARVELARLQEGLATLVEAEVLHRHGRLPQSRFAFKHALVQEAAYRSLLRTARREHHRNAADALEGGFPELVASEPELVAHHCAEAGLTERAILFWRRAGERAVARSQNREAVGHLTRGLALVETLPTGRGRSELELSLRVPLGHALMADAGYASAEVEGAYVRIRDVAREVGEAEQLGPALFTLWMNYVGRGMHEAALDAGQELLGAGPPSLGGPHVYVGHRAVGWPLLLMGDLAGARAHLEQMEVPETPEARRSLERYGADPVMAAEVFAAWVSGLQGRTDEARQRAAAGLELARSAEQPIGLAYALGMVSMLHHFLGEPREAAARGGEAVKLASEHGLAVWRGWASVPLGWALVEAGEAEAGALEIATGLETARSAGARLFEPYCLTVLAQAQGRAGRQTRGLELLDNALALARAHRELFYEAEMHRLRGELLVERGDPEAAEVALADAVEVARAQGARLFELRAAESLERLEADDRARKARAVSG
jgi:predicted ATPase